MFYHVFPIVLWYCLIILYRFIIFFCLSYCFICHIVITSYRIVLSYCIIPNVLLIFPLYFIMVSFLSCFPLYYVFSISVTFSKKCSKVHSCRFENLSISLSLYENKKLKISCLLFEICAREICKTFIYKHSEATEYVKK